MKAAIIPSLLYYFGLFIHVDAYAAVNGLKGLPKNELPSLVKVMKEGWFYGLALVLLIVLLFYRLEARAAYFTAVLIFILTNFNKDSRLSVKKMLQFFEQSGRLLAGLTTIFVAVGMIIGSMSLTGAGHSLSREIVALAGGNLALLLMLGAIASFILGMGMTITACYIFLAVVLAPALVQSGLNQMAVHLFVLYCAVLSYITPPRGDRRFFCTASGRSTSHVHSHHSIKVVDHQLLTAIPLRIAPEPHSEWTHQRNHPESHSMRAGDIMCECKPAWISPGHRNNAIR